MRLIRTIVLTLAIAPAACAPRPQPAVPPGPAPPVTIQILAINDLHGHLEPPPGSNGRINAVEAGGAEYLATHLRQAIARQPNSIVVAAGDLVGASPLVSSAFHDEPAIEALDAIGLSVTTVGNHEFDEGYEELLRLKRGGCHPRDGCQDGDAFDGARFDYLAANVVRKADGRPLFPATAVRTVGGVKVGFIGVTTRETAQIVPASVTRDLAFVDEADAANAAAAGLKREGVDAIVLLIHEGLRQRAQGPADPNGCATPGGALEAVVSRLSGDIGVVVSGHSHGFYNCRIGSRLVTSASSYGRMYTRITLTVAAPTGRIVTAEAANEIVTRDVPRDAAVAAVVAKYAKLVERVAGEVVGAVTGDLKTEATAAGESALGNLIADAQLAAASGAERGSAVVAFMNRGGVRAEILAGPGAAAGSPAPVTYGALHSVQPFGNTVMTLTMTGDMIRRLLEQQFDNPVAGARQILQVSNGFTYRYRSTAAPGQRVEAESIQVGGRRIAPSDRVRVAASDFLLNGGDGFSVFGEGTDRQAVIGDVEALVEYFRARSPIASPARDRIVRID